MAFTIIVQFCLTQFAGAFASTVPLSLTLASDNLSPNASSAFSMIPISMDVEEGAPQPEFRDIQPWDLKHPVAVYANRDGKQLMVYWRATYASRHQEYACRRQTLTHCA